MGAPPLYVSIDSIAGMPQKSEPYRKSRKKMAGDSSGKKRDVVEKTVSYSLAAKGIEGGAASYPHKTEVPETAKSKSPDLSTMSGPLKKINFSVFTKVGSRKAEL